MGFPKAETLKIFKPNIKKEPNEQVLLGRTLAGVTAANYFFRKIGLTDQLSYEEIKKILGVMCHPFLGWLGAYAANKPYSSSKIAKIPRIGASALLGLAINEAVESGQDLAPFASDSAGESQNDDVFDAAAAVGGVSAYFVAESISQAKKPEND